ncbi:MAG: hypothetical protein E7675_03365 [Ruminococcaceae bacterium]|nr:hypothetical protein [Oscillospiraceae bacterium]
MKKITTLILVFVMLFSFVSCSTEPVGTSTAPGTTETTTTPTGTKTPVAFGVNYTSYVLFAREKLLITATASEGTTWTSSNDAVATVKEGGIVTAVSKGSAEITATSKNGEKAVCKIKVINVADFYTAADITKLVLKKSELDKAVKEELDYMCEYFSEPSEVEREAKDGDTVRATYVGTLKGEDSPFDGGTGTSDIVLGSKQMIDGFEAGLVGAKKGETVTLNLKFPEKYIDSEKDAAAAEKLNGKEVTFVVTVHNVYESKPAELTDALIVKATNSAYKTVAEYTKYVEDSFKDYLKVELAITSGEVKGYDEEMLKLYKDIYLQNTYGTYASMYGMSIEDFVKTYYGLDAKALDEEATKSAKGYLEQLYLCYSLNLTPTEEERQETLKSYMTSIGYTDTVDAFVAAYGEVFAYNYVLTEFALTYVEKTITFDEAN